MKVKIIQSNTGQYNLLSSEVSFKFRLGIVDENGQVIEKEGIKAMLYYNGEADDMDEFQDPINDLDFIFEKCYGYAESLLYSSTPYKAQCLLFAKTYYENFESIDKTMLESEKQRIEKLIADLEKKKSYTQFIPTVSFESVISEDVKKINKSIAYNEDLLTQYIEGSEKFVSTNEFLNKLKERKLKLESFVEELNSFEIY